MAGYFRPIIRGVEGDTLKVVFYNKADKPYSVHPHGVHYDKDNEGAGMGMDPNMATAMPPRLMDCWKARAPRFNREKKYTYTWSVTLTPRQKKARAAQRSGGITRM